MKESQKNQSRRGLAGAWLRASTLGVLALSAFLWTACQEQNPAAAKTAAEESLTKSQSVTGNGEDTTKLRCGNEVTTTPVEAPKDICSQPGPITRGLGTPRCNMHVTEEVCGCDGKTYQNGCLAWTYDVNVAHKGACK